MAPLVPTEDSKTLAHGRGAPSNPVGRFERLDVAYDVREVVAGQQPGDDQDADARTLKTEFYKDSSRSVLTFNDSPDLAMDATLNPYRGCEHGCIYCYARPYHEYLGLSAGVDFESRIFVKADAPALLREALMAKSWTPQVVTMSGVTDCYQPVERRLKLTRACLEVLAEFQNPVGVITKNAMVTRDIDVLRRLAAFDGVQVFLSITTLDEELARTLEPRASTPALKLEALRALRDAGIPTGVMMAPIIPGLTDHEIPALLEAVADAGAMSAGRNVVRLPHGVKDLFAQWLETHYPARKEKVLNRIRAMRGGKLNDPRFGTRMRGEGPFADSIHQMFDLHARKLGLNRRIELNTTAFRRPGGQLDLF
jgi:DNA repair photolyase